MKIIGLNVILVLALVAGSCDVQSGISKKSVEKYATTPTPERTPLVVEKIDPTDVVTVETKDEGPNILVNTLFKGTTVNCDKYNRVSVNGNSWELTIKGPCKRLVINGDRNKIAAIAFAEIMVNGSDNSVTYSKYVNGKMPSVSDNGENNTIEKGTATEAAK
jgi:hypothetical protein